VATFGDASSTDLPTDYTATINWGDGGSSTGLVSGLNGSFSVSGTHTYVNNTDQDVTYTLSVTITDDGGATVTVTGFATVSPVPKYYVGSFAEVDKSYPYDPPSDFNVVLDWGDGGTSTGIVGGSGYVYYVMGSHTYKDAGTYPVTMTVHDVDGAVVSTVSTAMVVDAFLAGAAPAAALAGPSATVREVTFLDIGTPITNDKEQKVEMKDKQWLDLNGDGIIQTAKGEHQYPATYVRNTTLNLKAVFDVANLPPTTTGVIVSGEAKGTAIDSTGAKVTQVFPLVPQTVAYAGGKTVTVNSIKAKDAFKNVATFDTLDITWKLVLVGVPALPIPFPLPPLPPILASLAPGTSANTVYITYDKPTGPGGKLFQTVLATGSVMNAKAAADTQDTARDNAWKKFEPPGAGKTPNHVVSANPGTLGSVLTYYSEWISFPEGRQTTSALVRTLDGDCVAWARFLLDVLKAQGIKYTDNFFIAAPEVAGEWIGVVKWTLPAKGNSDIPAYDYLNTWTTNATSVDKVQPFDKAGTYSWTTSDVTDAAGVAGQGKDDPRSIFVNHVVTQLTVGGKKVLYDPSYGLTFTDVGDLDKRSIALYFAGKNLGAAGGGFTKFAYYSRERAPINKGLKRTPFADY
jgi:hypothetical protein